MMRKKTAKEVKQELEQRLREIESLKEEAEQKGLGVRYLSEKELVGKITGKTSNSPYVYLVIHTLQTTPGSSAALVLNISNPDPVRHRPLFVSMFFGLANFFDVPELLSGRDAQWPYVSTPWFSLAAGATTSKHFTYTVQTDVSRGTYLNNWVLWEGGWFGKGSYLERGLVELGVVDTP
jgi:hypothetical protein